MCEHSWNQINVKNPTSHSFGLPSRRTKIPIPVTKTDLRVVLGHAGREGQSSAKHRVRSSKEPQATFMLAGQLLRALSSYMQLSRQMTSAGVKCHTPIFVPKFHRQPHRPTFRTPHARTFQFCDVTASAKCPCQP